jgi:hypothetical protein
MGKKAERKAKRQVAEAAQIEDAEEAETSDSAGDLDEDEASDQGSVSGDEGGASEDDDDGDGHRGSAKRSSAAASSSAGGGIGNVMSALLSRSVPSSSKGAAAAAGGDPVLAGRQPKMLRELEEQRAAERLAKERLELRKRKQTDALVVPTLGTATCVPRLRSRRARGRRRFFLHSAAWAAG